MSTAWTDRENAAICALYFAMLDATLSNVRFNKRGVIRFMQGDGGDYLPALVDMRGTLHARSRGSIEAKLMNCTAAHESLEAGAHSMAEHGYRPLTRYQSALRIAMRDALAERVALPYVAAS